VQWHPEAASELNLFRALVEAASQATAGTVAGPADALSGAG
jgi:gamma-glutamyl-gamma-aminobutyrate hydrolase PuuD